MSSKRLQTSDKYKLSQRVFIQQEITFKTLKTDKVRVQLNKMKDDLRTVVSFFDWLHIANTFADSIMTTIKRVLGVQDYKVAQLLGSTLTHDPKEVIYNFSSYVLSETEKMLLCKGLNFVIPPKKMKFENELLPFEILLLDVCDNSDKVTDADCLLDLKCKIKDVGLSSLRSYNKKDHRFKNLTKNEYAAFLSLKSNNNIVIQKADKGNTVVILDQVSYVFEVEKFLGDTSKFINVTFNPKHKVKKEVRHLIGSNIKHRLGDLFENNYLRKKDYNFMKPCGSKPGVLYRLCKVMKNLMD